MAILTDSALPATAGLHGTVRSYNGSKGFGFIVGQGQFEDVMFSRNELPEDAREVRGQILTGRQVVFDARINPDGRAKATQVKLIAEDGQKLPGVIKSFSSNNGYGFVKSSCLTNDVYFSAQDFAGLVPGANLQGQLVLFEVQTQASGKLKASRIQFQTRKIAEQFAAPSMSWSSPTPRGNNAHAALSNAANSGLLPGIVKTFSERNGYGFIQVPGLPVDIMFRQQVVHGDAVVQGSAVQFTLTQSQDGRLQASQVFCAGDPGMKRAAGAEGFESVKQSKLVGSPVPTTATGQVMTGMVKSYNAQKGWGLISSAGIPGGEVLLVMSSS